jgi:hypothetical protein
MKNWGDIMSKVELNLSDTTEYLLTEWLIDKDDRFTHGSKILKSSYMIDVVSKDDIINQLLEHFHKTEIDTQYIPVDKSYIFQLKFMFVVVSLGAHIADIVIYYKRDSHGYTRLQNYIENNFSVRTNYIKWIYSRYGECINIPINTDVTPYNEMYPFLKGEPLNEYYDRFFKSNSAVLLLHGEAGTGKTTFLNGMLSHSNKIARITYDSNLIESDDLFADFVDSDDMFFIIEDADAFLTKRDSGNTLMHKFLNVGDGLGKVKSKKIIFTTNLSTTSKIDSALIRKGRCFDVLEFKKLKAEEARLLANKVDINIDIEEDKEYTIAEIFNEKENKIKQWNKFGFLGEKL